MKKMLVISIISFPCFLLIGCDDTYKENSNSRLQKKELSSLQREVNYLIHSSSNLPIYTFDEDTLNQTNCDLNCQKTWPIFTGMNTQSSDIEIFDSNTAHLAYRKHPLYFYKEDTAQGDIGGNNIDKKWHLIYAPTPTNDSQTKFSADSDSMTQTYLTDAKGRSLYRFDKDDLDSSKCYEECEETWPVFYQENLGNLPFGTQKSDFSTITRDLMQSKYSKQTSYKGSPLYYYVNDNQLAESTKGDWFKGSWHLVELSAKKTSLLADTPYTKSAIAKGRELFINSNNCMACHGVDGLTPPLGVDNIIAKYGDAAQIEQKLRDMRDNGNPKNRHPAMVNIASNLTDEMITNLSAFIGTLKQ